MRGLEQRARGQRDGEDVMQVVEGDADPRAEPVPVGGLADTGLDVQARAAEAEPWGLDFLPRLKAGDSYSASLMGHRGSVGSRFMGDRVAAGRSQPPSHIASTGV